MATATDPGAQPERRGGAGPVGGLLGGKDPHRPLGTIFLAGFIAWLDETQDPEYIVIAGGSVVVCDAGHQVHAHGSVGDDVNSATPAEAGTAVGAGGTAVSAVVDDRAASDREARGAVWGGSAVEHAAALAVSTVAAQAAGATD